MGLSAYNVKKWLRMLTGKSIMHVNQGPGLYFAPGELKGYFNDLTEKVLKDPETLKAKTIPMSSDEKAGKVYFPVAVFQYGLGAYDLYIGTKEEIYKEQFMRCVEWALEHQEENGAWNNFGFVQPDAPYGAMCQGEGCSLLLRAYQETGNYSYLGAATKALDFMLNPVQDGGTAQYEGDDLILLEYTYLPAVLNGWIFASFGLYDMSLVSSDPKYKEAFAKTVKSIERYLPRFDNGYWSKYDLGKTITSPFYHNLHIAQMHGLYLATGDEIFKQYEDKWTKYRSKWWNRKRAFIKKAWQKVIEK